MALYGVQGTILVRRGATYALRRLVESASPDALTAIPDVLLGALRLLKVCVPSELCRWMG